MRINPVYRELRKQLDEMPVPYPETQSGVEIRILERLFTPEEAQVALWVSAIPEPVNVIHRRGRGEIGVEELGAALERMAAKGLLSRSTGKKGPMYGKLPLALGMYEMQVDRLTEDLERDVRAYFEERFVREALRAERTPQMRTVPVHESIDAEWPVASHEDMRKYVESSEGPFAAIHCICRQGKDLTGEPCRQTRERRNCLMIGPAARSTVEAGVGRELSREETLAMLERADREGLVLQPQNTQAPMFICCCCGCCCGLLTEARKFERPADAFQAACVAEIDRDRCRACGICGTRCQMAAIVDSESAPAVAAHRCIGCGLCVTACPCDAVRLKRVEGRPAPPANAKALYAKMYGERFGRAAVAVALARHVAGRRV